MEHHSIVPKYIKKIYQSSNKKILYLLAAMVAFMILDGVLTQFLVPSGAFKEANPFIAPLVGQTGFMILKIVGALVCAIILWDVHRRFPRLGLIATWIAVTGCAAIVLWNASQVLLI
jgi:hypothetical protein